jgi:hypothetical protein
VAVERKMLVAVCEAVTIALRTTAFVESVMRPASEALLIVSWAWRAGRKRKSGM